MWVEGRCGWRGVWSEDVGGGECGVRMWVEGRCGVRMWVEGRCGVRMWVEGRCGWKGGVE